MPRMRFPLAMVEGFTIRLSREEKAAMQDAARQRGISVADLVRSATRRVIDEAA